MRTSRAGCWTCHSHPMRGGRNKCCAWSGRANPSSIERGAITECAAERGAIHPPETRAAPSKPTHSPGQAAQDMTCRPRGPSGRYTHVEREVRPACGVTHLLPIAGELRMHDVFDSIGLWIWHCDSERLTDHLKRIAQSEEDPDMRSHYEWLIQGRCSSTTSTPTRDGSS